MKTGLPGKFYYFAIAAVSVVLLLTTFTPYSYSLESSTSLPVLYKIRNFVKQPVAPDNIIIVTPYRERQFDSPDYLRNLDRRDHAAAVDTLVSLGVDVIAVDLYFRSKRPIEDEVLATSMNRVSKLVVSQLVRPLPITAGGVKGYYLRNPVVPLINAATSLAPPSVPSTTASVNRVPLFRTVLHPRDEHACSGFPARAESLAGAASPGDMLSSTLVPTFAFSVLEQHILHDMQASESHKLWLGNVMKVRSDGRLNCQLMTAMRKLQITGALAGVPQFDRPDVQGRFVLWQEMVNEQAVRQREGNTVATLHLNFIGPPRSIKTLSYADLAVYADQTLEGDIPSFFENATVFMGGSFDDPEDQKEDGFRTAFASGSERMSGVEINATALHNMMNGNALVVMHGWVGAAYVVLAAFLVIFAASKMRMPALIVLTILGVLSTLTLTLYAFMQHQIWLPVGTMVLSLLSYFAITAVWKYRASSQERDRAVHHLRSFLSDAIAAQLDTGENHVVKKAVCMVTDIRNFTEHGRGLKPGDLHRSNDVYFTRLFDCVSAENVDVVKTYGDSMTAVWASDDNQNLERAVRAGAKILEAQWTDNAQHAENPETHIGLHAGDVAIGFVGDANRRTVEVTGNAVYVAARLEQLNKKLNTRFLATAAVGRTILTFKTIRKGPSTLKGYAEPMDVVEIVTPRQTMRLDSGNVLENTNREGNSPDVSTNAEY